MWDERRRRYPGLVFSAMDDDVMLHQRNAAPARWPEHNWRFTGGVGPLLETTLELAIRLRESRHADAAWVADQLRQLVVTALTLAVEAVASPQRASRGGKPVAVRVRNHLREALADPHLDVPAVAAALGYHPRSLGQRYRRETGENLRSTLCHLRIQRARRLLRQRDLPIAEVARRCGFTTPAHFSRTFTRIEGFPPRQYRKYGHLEEDGEA